MIFAQFDQRLIDTMIDRCKIVGVLWIIILLTLAIEALYCWKTKSNQGVSIWNLFSKKPIFLNRLSLKQRMGRKLIVAIILPVLMIWLGLPVYNDIAQQQYIQAQANYSRNENTSKNHLFSNGYVVIETGNEEIRLELPANWTEQEFPEGLHCGTVWYSQESKVILSFTEN